MNKVNEMRTLVQLLIRRFFYIALLGLPTFFVKAHGVYQPMASSQLSSDENDLKPQVSGQETGGETHSLPLVATRKVEIETDEGSWMSVDLSANGKQIVFDLLGDIFTLDAQGGEAKLILGGMAVETQPTYSPDASMIAFISDRSGAENIWISKTDGTDLQQISFFTGRRILVSPSWSADGKVIYVSLMLAELSGYELWQFDATGRDKGTPFIPIAGEQEKTKTHVLGVSPSADGKYLYYAGSHDEIAYGKLPEWKIQRLTLASGEKKDLVYAAKSPRSDLSFGSFFSPVVAPNGRLLAYASRYEGQTALRLLDMETGEDRWLAYPIQHDAVESAPWSGHIPAYSFTPDSSALILNINGKIQRLDIRTSDSEIIPFQAKLSIDLGPATRKVLPEETGDVRARLIQTPEQSADGSRLVFSAMAHIYTMPLDGRSSARRLSVNETPAFHPSWSPDGSKIVYVTWTAKEAGHIWVAEGDGQIPPRRITAVPDFYTNPVFSPDGQSVIAIRSNNVQRMKNYMEYGLLRKGTLLSIGLKDGVVRELLDDTMGGKPHFLNHRNEVVLNFEDGLNAVSLKDGSRRRVLTVVGPGWYFIKGPQAVTDSRISPDGKWALEQNSQQLYLVAVPDKKRFPVNLSDSGAVVKRLTKVGADFFAWADDGATITWAIGSTYYQRPLASVINTLDGNMVDTPLSETDAAVSRYEVKVELPRDIPEGKLVLRGATALTMKGTEIIKNADVLIVNNKIAAIGKRGQVKFPRGTSVHSLRGKYIVPGFIDAHDHFTDLRRDVLNLESWGLAANLAYGVTSTLDPSSLTIDAFAYKDLLETGRMTGSRIFTTGMALFSFNEFQSLNEVEHVLRRYKEHYRTRNLKMYRTGNRRVRQWIAMAAHSLGMLPTTEGVSMKLQLSHILDGFAGSEHEFPVTPLYKDVVQLFAQTQVHYTPTLIISSGGQGQDYFIVKDDARDDPKLNRFWPRFVIDIKMQQRTWRPLSEYYFPRLAKAAAKIKRAGGLVAVGSHGEAPGLGTHWEMRALAMGGMSPMEVLHSATMGSAEAIGRHAVLGSLEPGKYADLVVLNKDPRSDISNTLSIHQVMKNGRLYDGNTLDEVWPRQRKMPSFWFRDSEPPMTIQ